MEGRIIDDRDWKDGKHARRKAAKNKKIRGMPVSGSLVVHGEGKQQNWILQAVIISRKMSFFIYLRKVNSS